MKEINEIIKNPLNAEEIEKMFLNKTITNSERMLLYAVKSKETLRMYMTGKEPFKLKIIDLPEETYFTNVGVLINAFHSLYKKIPDYHFDEIFDYSLRDLSKQVAYTYEFLTILHTQLQFEKKGDHSFKINGTELLEFSKGLLTNRNYVERMSNIKKFDGSLTENGIIGVYRKYNETFKEQLGIDLFEEESTIKTL